jgi:hypothetical protein
MKTSLLPRLLLVLGLLAGQLLAQHAADQENLLPEGAFPGVVGGPVRGWQVPHPNHLAKLKATMELIASDDGKTYNVLRIVNDDPNQVIAADTSMEINPAWVGRTLVIRAEMRVARFTPGKESWNNARIILRYQRKEGKPDYPSALFLDFDQPRWKSLVTRWKVPADAVALDFSIGLMNATGVMDVRDLTVTLE